MPLTIEQYHKATAAQRKKIKRDELQTILDEHLNTDGNFNSLRGILREELTTQLKDIKDDLTRTIDAKIKTFADENEKLLSENKAIKNSSSGHAKRKQKTTYSSLEFRTL